MKREIIRGKHLRKIGIPEGKPLGIALAIARKLQKRQNTAQLLDIVMAIYAEPELYSENEDWKTLAEALIELNNKGSSQELNQSKSFEVFGAKNIEQGALHQMHVAMKLPITVAGALMPDAHLGYGLPIGGVLATHNAVIPYGVGVDIGCRMCLSVLPISEKELNSKTVEFGHILQKHSRFGNKEVFDDVPDHEILDRGIFKEINMLRPLQARAYKQLGTSGGGNHFVEFGLLNIDQFNEALLLAPGKYMALLTHSGSRGLGANIAGHYTRLARSKCKLPKEAQHLAWLDLDTEEGQEYWMAMNLAGDYASACHNDIHRRIAKALNVRPLAKVENHHNFAWKEQLINGTEVIVHRKGATPAAQGDLGIIPGSMTQPGFVVMGLGNPLSLNSASHGAGRLFSRTHAKNTITPSAMKKELKNKGVTLFGADVDEAPMAYKDIHQVMENQKELVEVLATFQPKIVRMNND
jgi:tRNA-splicing ligase RtcB